MKIKFEGSKAHFSHDMKPSHGPQQWPWWRLLSFGLVRQDIQRPSTGRRLWIYTRWGAFYVGIIIDMRAKV